MRNKFKRTIVTLAAMAMLASSTLTAFAEDTVTEITDKNGTADVKVQVTVQSSFKVGIPTSVTLNSNGEGSYDVKVSGDIDPTKKLVVAPQDGYLPADGDSTANINYKLEDKSTADEASKKDPIIIKVTTGDTEFTCLTLKDTSADVPKVISNSISIEDGKLTAGDWATVIKYSISLEDIN